MLPWPFVPANRTPPAPQQVLVETPGAVSNSSVGVLSVCHVCIFVLSNSDWAIMYYSSSHDISFKLKKRKYEKN